MPFAEYFPRGNIYEMISPDILHQLIKGTFKDHCITWVEQAIHTSAPNRKSALQVLDLIDRRIAVVPPFTGLRHFPQGRRFKQWTGDDSKALMKVYLPALIGLVPMEMICAVRAFLEFCYIVRKDAISTTDISNLKDALNRFHQFREIFVTVGVRKKNTIPPRQHSMVHYPYLIRAFGAPNGLCSSITESKHIKAVKEPYRRSNRYEALGQMLITNQRNDKLAAARNHFEKLGMLEKKRTPQGKYSLLVRTIQYLNVGVAQNILHLNCDGDDILSDDDEGIHYKPPVSLAKKAIAPRMSLSLLAPHLSPPQLNRLLVDYLTSSNHINVSEKRIRDLLFTVYPSVVARFYAPSDGLGLHGFKSERIRAVSTWRNQGARYDTVFVKGKPGSNTISTGLTIARVRRFFSFTFNDQIHECGLVNEYHFVGTGPDEETGMWIVQPTYRSRSIVSSIIPIKDIYRASHLLPQFTDKPDTLDSYQRFYAFEAAQ
ncbi:hypothetical protein AGABI1DRAFT_102708 [Agaricus bisporus var. burnettii JB137-S8]|uniref:Uncharacterized protein n=2 Tax=Agaricus bisporus var. burnettii (strain JB137-S8 / ATCC MYA-4627 / FGSC 10392) TaxID=597362 RepID=K5WYL4_AGABU|nr:uncharacterized protein AGABI1DRAFT_102708 [Agaricus bisporus var. burnettii JB137-S8]EKM75692.1 hypothetical protein AGABI1DRAFT_102708 [Agaricus bisporus var. burnettii JB137-S8]